MGIHPIFRAAFSHPNFSAFTHPNAGVSKRVLRKHITGKHNPVQQPMSANKWGCKTSFDDFQVESTNFADLAPTVQLRRDRDKKGGNVLL